MLFLFTIAMLTCRPYQLTPQPRGSLLNLLPSPLMTASNDMAPGEVLLAVTAVGLNFRDVLNVLGMYPGDPGAPGEAVP